MPRNAVRALRLVGLSCAGVLVLATHACRSPTDVVLDISTELPCSGLHGVSIVVAPDPASAEDRARTSYYAAVTTQCDSESTVGTLTLTPGGSTVAVVVIAGIDRDSSSCAPPDYAGCVVARRRLAFVDHESLRVPIAIEKDCKDVPCDTDTSCVHGNCKSSDTSCSGDSCAQVGVEDAGGSTDGTTPLDEAGVDGAQLDASDAMPLDAGGDAAADAGPLYDGGTYTCLSAPSCGSGLPVPCSCAGLIGTSGDGGTKMMTLSCPAAGATCACRIDGLLVHTFPNPGMCRDTDYGNVCCH